MDTPLVYKPEPVRKPVLKKVTNVLRGTTERWYHVGIKDAAGNFLEELVCTSEHPFYIPSKGAYIAARDLAEGEDLLTVGGREAFIAYVNIEELDEPAVTYNIEVEGAHNYFVGSIGILVHNICVAEDGPYKAVVNISNEHGQPHAHILKNGQRMAQVDKLGQVSKGVFDHGAKNFVNSYWDDILKGINKYYPKK